MNTAPPVALVVEDDVQLRRFLRATLGAHGFAVVETESVSMALAELTARPPDVVLLDLALPDGDGIALTRRLREWSHVPVVVLSARGRESDKVDALDAGADDYLTKPFGTNELLARIRVSLRHARRELSPSSPVLSVGALSVDLDAHVVTVDGSVVHVTPTEYRLLVFLMRNEGRVVTHQTLLRELWGTSHTHRAHHVRVFMATLRAKIERDPARPRFLQTEQGVGYRLRASDS